MPHVKQGEGWLPGNKAYAVNVPYFNGLDGNDDCLDTLAEICQQTQLASAREYLLDHLHDRLVKRLAKRYGQMHFAYDVFSKPWNRELSTFDHCLATWDAKRGSFFPYLLGVSIGKIRTDRRRDTQRAALEQQLLNDMLGNAQRERASVEHDKGVMLEALARMPVRDQVVVQLLNGIGVPEWTERKLARVLGVSHVRTHQLHVRAMELLAQQVHGTGCP